MGYFYRRLSNNLATYVSGARNGKDSPRVFELIILNQSGRQGIVIKLAAAIAAGSTQLLLAATFSA